LTRRALGWLASPGAARLWVAAAVAMNDLLDIEHGLLDVQCLDRI
jgi:hypothetical protein